MTVWSALLSLIPVFRGGRKSLDPLPSVRIFFAVYELLARRRSRLSPRALAPVSNAIYFSTRPAHAFPDAGETAGVVDNFRCSPVIAENTAAFPQLAALS
jgi:hypothetical protein